MLVLVQVSKNGGIGVYGPFGSTTDPKLMKIITEGGYENDIFPFDGEYGIQKGFNYKNKKGHHCVVCKVEPMNSTSIIFGDTLS